MGLIINGQVVEVPGLAVQSWRDVPAWRLRVGVEHPDGRAHPGRKVLGVVVHTTKGIPGGSNHTAQHVKPGAGPSGGIAACARWWSLDPSPAGAHVVIEDSGLVACLGDMGCEDAFHAGHPNNDWTAGVEVYQDADGGIWQASIDSWVILAAFLCDYHNLPRQVTLPYHGGPCVRLDKPGGIDYRGVYGHRDCDHHRGFGDPGDILLQALVDHADFEAVDVNENEDLDRWRERQRRLNALGWEPPLDVDGIPGPKTMAAWRARGAETHNGYTEPVGGQAA